MARSISLFLSYVFMPLLIPTLIFLFLVFNAPAGEYLGIANKLLIVAMVFSCTFLIPVLSLFALKITRSIASWHMGTKEERVFPFSAISLFYLLTTYMFYIKLNAEPIYLLTLGTISACLILLTAITFFWKISAHMTGIAGFLAIVVVMGLKFPTVNAFPFIIICLIATGLVGSARLYLNAHRPQEVWAGFFLGFSVCFLAFYHYL